MTIIGAIVLGVSFPLVAIPVGYKLLDKYFEKSLKKSIDK